MRCAFVIDPLPSLIVHHDTSVALMYAAAAQGYAVSTLEIGDLWVQAGQAWATVQTLQLHDAVPGTWYSIIEKQTVALAEFDWVWMRKDPPVDAAYITATQILDLAQTKVLNNPTALRSANEKLYALQWPQWTPETLVTGAKSQIREFVQRLGKAVLKPLDGKGGEGIFFLTSEDRNLNSLIEVSTQWGQRPVMVQAYLPAATEGDKRILLWRGQPLGAVNRIPGTGDFRGNIAAGGRVAATEITDRERALCADLAPVLQAADLDFVGIDVIGGYLTEVNVTSPTMLREMSDLIQTDLAAQVIADLVAA